MFDLTDPKQHVIAAALRLAETRGWRDLSIADIAAEAQMPLVQFRDVFSSKAAILDAFSDAVDRDVLNKFAKQGADAPRDRMFDVIISRFETLMPFKPAIKRIVEDGGASFAQLGPALRSQYWMLAAAGINAEGAAGLMRVQGLLSIYSRAFQTWLEDDDPGMARTMAVLDRRLRRAEATVARVERIRDGLSNLAGVVRRGVRRKADDIPHDPELTPARGTPLH